MFYRLKRHPWPVVARFEQCLVLAYAVPSTVLAGQLPPGLELDVYRDDCDREFGFLAIALVQTEACDQPFCLARSAKTSF